MKSKKILELKAKKDFEREWMENDIEMYLFIIVMILITINFSLILADILL